MKQKQLEPTWPERRRHRKTSKIIIFNLKLQFPIFLLVIININKLLQQKLLLFYANKWINFNFNNLIFFPGYCQINHTKFDNVFYFLQL